MTNTVTYNIAQMKFSVADGLLKYDFILVFNSIHMIHRPNLAI